MNLLHKAKQEKQEKIRENMRSFWLSQNNAAAAARVPQVEKSLYTKHIISSSKALILPGGRILSLFCGRGKLQFRILLRIFRFAALVEHVIFPFPCQECCKLHRSEVLVKSSISVYFWTLSSSTYQQDINRLWSIPRVCRACLIISFL